MKKVLYWAIGFLIGMGISAILYYSYTSMTDLKLLGLSLWEWLNKQNPMIAGAISLWALGSFTYLGRSVPAQIWSIVVKQSTVRLVINNEDNVYTHFLIWYHRTGKSEKSRTLVAKNFWNEVDEKETLVVSAGYGIHFFVFEGQIFRLSRDLKENNNSRVVKESLTLTTIGRSQKQFHSIIKAITPEKMNKDVTSICQWDSMDAYWNTHSEQPVRKFSSVILPEKNKHSIVDHIETFLSNKEWYLEHGIPYRTGIILHGVPGTGKTSLVRGLCEKFDKPLHVLSLSGMSDSSLEKALSSLPRNAILLMEDIDTYDITASRETDSDTSILSMLTLSGLLNAIDGIISSDGRILVATTNHIEKLDSALTRKGRFNLNIEIGVLTQECFKEFFKQFFPDFDLPSDIKFDPNMAPATLQAKIIDNLNEPQKVLEFCSK